MKGPITVFSVLVGCTFILCGSAHTVRFEPEYNKHNGPLEVKVGDNITCSTGLPQARVRWEKDHGDGLTTEAVDGDTLTVKDHMTRGVNKYRCTVRTPEKTITEPILFKATHKLWCPSVVTPNAATGTVGLECSTHLGGSLVELIKRHMYNVVLYEGPPRNRKPIPTQLFKDISTHVSIRGGEVIITTKVNLTFSEDMVGKNYSCVRYQSPLRFFPQAVCTTQIMGKKEHGVSTTQASYHMEKKEQGFSNSQESYRTGQKDHGFSNSQESYRTGQKDHEAGLNIEFESSRNLTEETILEVGDTVKCKATGQGLRFFWRSIRTNIFESPSSLIEGDLLTITEAMAGKVGLRYLCVVTSTHSSKTTSSAKLFTFGVSGGVRDIKINDQTTQKVMKMRVGQYLTCSAKGKPEPMYTWRRLSPWRLGKSVISGQKLKITSDMIGGRNRYTCTATNFSMGKAYSQSAQVQFDVSSSLRKSTWRSFQM